MSSSTFFNMYRTSAAPSGAGSGIVGVILAGGKSSRMGSNGPKCLTDLGGKTILRRVIDRAGTQCNGLILNANDDLDLMEGYGLPIVKDSTEGYAGPLAGILAAMDWVTEHVENCTHIASFPSDSPFFPLDLVQELRSTIASSKKPLAYATCKGRSHPVFGIWPVSLVENLRESLIEKDIRKVDAWTKEMGVAAKAFRAPGGVDPFFNINTVEDLAVAERMLSKIK